MILALPFVAFGSGGQADLVAARRNLMPVPAEVVFGGAPLVVDRGFSVAVVGPAGGVAPRVERAVVRMLGRLGRQTGIPVPARIEPDAARARLRIEYLEAVPAVQRAVENEAYTLEVGADGALLRAPTPYGVLRGLETLLQLVEVAAAPIDGVGGSDGVSSAAEIDSIAAARAATVADLAAEPADFIIPGVLIRDAPRFPWRGLLLDPGRHFLSLDTVKRNLDAMAAVKLSVLHWHLSEDQGFRVESKLFPELHERGSDGRYYTQEEIREVIAYAHDRGIRVMPEFDMPGHATSWFVGYPQLASAPGPYEIIESWGIQDPVMDPTREQTYEFLAAFIGEMAGLFPDAYFHIGGDEVNGVQWSASEHIQQFILDNDLVDNHGLQTYFNRRVAPLLAAHGKTMMGWDEIFQPGLPPQAVVHSWRGPEGVAEAAGAGHRTVLSNGYYIDLMQSAAQHYAVDPLGGPAAELGPRQRALVLGGEATMWGEYVVDETVDSRIWPRTAAIAERLWSEGSVTEVDDMYRRLQATSRWLESTGVTHPSRYQPMLERHTGGRPVGALRTLADVLEPIKGYRRGRTRAYTRFTPLNRLVDAARPESELARSFARMVNDYLQTAAGPDDAAGPDAAAGADAGMGPDGTAASDARLVASAPLRRQLGIWRDNHAALTAIARASTLLPEAEALSQQLRAAAEIALQALRDIESDRAATAAETAARSAALDGVEQPHGALQIMVVPAVRRLVDAAAGNSR